eukprot:g1949.t1
MKDKVLKISKIQNVISRYWNKTLEDKLKGGKTLSTDEIILKLTRKELQALYCKATGEFMSIKKKADMQREAQQKLNLISEFLRSIGNDSHTIEDEEEEQQEEDEYRYEYVRKYTMALSCGMFFRYCRHSTLHCIMEEEETEDEDSPSESSVPLVSSSGSNVPLLSMIRTFPGLTLFMFNYLGPSDCLRFSSTCKAARRFTSVKMLDHTFTHYNASGQHQYKAKLISYIPFLTSPKQAVRKLFLFLRAKDQGWGNRKGGLYICRTRTHEDREELRSVLGDDGYYLYGRNRLQPDKRVLVDSGILEQTFQSYCLKCELTGAINDDCKLDLFIRVGGGGGHEIQIEGGIIYVLQLINPSVEVSSFDPE